MKDLKDSPESGFEDSAEALLQQLFHLKRYETPDAARMTRNKQNIMRMVREENSRKKWNFSDLLEVNIPWFFAEPRYGIAALFVIFAMLQFWGVNAQKELNGKSGIYAPNGAMAEVGHDAPAYTNRMVYPQLPDNLKYFPNRQVDGDIKFVGRLEPKK